MRDLVLLGGGHTHALVLLAWANAPPDDVRVTLIDPVPRAAYSGMLPGHVAGHYPRAAIEIDLQLLARYAGIRHLTGAACGIDRQARTVDVGGYGPLGYDLLSLDIGVTSAPADLPGFSAHAIPVKPLGHFAAAWEAFCTEHAANERPLRVALIGAGVAGAELALAMDYRLRRDGAQTPQITLIEAGTALSALARPAAAILRDRLRCARIRLIQHAGIARISPGTAHLADGREIPFDFCAGAAGARPHPWLAGTGLPLTDGFVTVTAELRSVGDTHIFAAGDCASLAAHPRPKAGVFAVRQAPVLAYNLRAVLCGSRALRAYRPQTDYLKLISLGGKEALAEKWGLCRAAPWLWHLKDRIDRRFMAQFQDLPPEGAPQG